MSRRTKWIIAFLGVTALGIGMEIYAAADGKDETPTWTELVIEHINWEVTAVIVGGLILWLPLHWGVRYLRKHKKESK